MKSLFIISFVLIGGFRCQELKDFDDSVLYRIDWPGKIDLQYDPSKFEELLLTTNDNEKYRCITPSAQPRSEQEQKFDVKLSPLHFISPIFSTQVCSYRIEAYWTYEICHGQHIKQYHEERDGKQVKMQEFYLGKWSDEKNEKLKQKLKEDTENNRKFRSTKIDNINYPYLEMEMSDGTDCDLNDNEPRSTKVRYVCFPHGKNEIYSFKETSSCNYEAVVLTSVLCMHPAFVPEESKENLINCLPIDDAPEKPMSWLVNEIDNLKYRYKRAVTGATKLKKNIAIIKINEKTGTVQMDIINSEMNDQLSKFQSAFPDEYKENSEEDHHQHQTSPSPKTPDVIKTEKTTKFSTKATDTTPLIDFLTGKHCLTGGTGWWKYEFCYGRFVRQYHIDNSGENSLVLGVFNENSHKEWLKLHPDRRPKSKSVRTEISHFYQGGTLCDKTGEKRETEVKLKCLLNSGSPAQVSMYLLEPKTCHYILVVESPIICEVLQIADNNGLVSEENFTSDKLIGNSVNTKDKSASSDALNIPIEGLEIRYENN